MEGEAGVLQQGVKPLPVRWRWLNPGEGIG